MRLAEERGEVGGDRVGEFLELGGDAALEQLDVFTEGFELQRAQAPRQASVDELALRVRQRDAGVLAHQLRGCDGTACR